MTDDDPIEEARVAAMTGGAAAARVVEVAMQAAQRRREDEAGLARRRIHRDVDDAVQAQRKGFDLLSDSDRWRGAAGHATEKMPSTHDQLKIKHSPDTTKPEASELTAAATRYDSPVRRRAAEQILMEAEVQGEPRAARSVSDLLNATDPARAAKYQSAQRPPVSTRVQSYRQKANNRQMKSL